MQKKLIKFPVIEKVFRSWKKFCSSSEMHIAFTLINANENCALKRGGQKIYRNIIFFATLSILWKLQVSPYKLKPMCRWQRKLLFLTASLLIFSFTGENEDRKSINSLRKGMDRKFYGHAINVMFILRIINLLMLFHPQFYLQRTFLAWNFLWRRRQFCIHGM